MHILTFNFIAKVDEPDAVRDAHAKVIDAMMATPGCLGAQILHAKSRREPNRYMFQSVWRDRDEAVALMGTPEMREIHDVIYTVQSGQVTMGVWSQLYAKGVVAGEDVADKIAGAPQPAAR